MTPTDCRAFGPCFCVQSLLADVLPYNCPGDDDLEHVLSARDLVAALDSTFRIIEGCLDRWTLDMLDEELRRPEWDDSSVHTRGSVIQRVFSHDVYHCADLNGTLGAAGVPQIDLWD